MLGDAASLATAVGVFLAVVGLRQAQIQRVRTFESLYVKRYWDLMDKLSLESMCGKDCAADEKYIRGYLTLCEDQVELREGGWISDATWRVWEEGIRQQMNHPCFGDVYDRVRAESEHTQLKALTRLLEGDGEPLPKPGAWTRFSHGLTGG